MGKLLLIQPLNITSSQKYMTTIINNLQDYIIITSHYLNSGLESQPRLLTHTVAGIIERLGCENQQLWQMFTEFRGAPATQRRDERHGGHPLVFFHALRGPDQYLDEYRRPRLVPDAQDHALCVLDDLGVCEVSLKGVDEGGDDAIEMLVESIT